MLLTRMPQPLPLLSSLSVTLSETANPTRLLFNPWHVRLSVPPGHRGPGHPRSQEQLVDSGAPDPHVLLTVTDTEANTTAVLDEFRRPPPLPIRI